MLWEILIKISTLTYKKFDNKFKLRFSELNPFIRKGYKTKKFQL